LLSALAVSAKQRKAIVRNARLNYLIDAGVSVEDIKAEISNLNTGFILNIRAKRQKNAEA